MKKIMIVTLVVAMLLGLTACSFNQNMSGALAGEAEATPRVYEMMDALTEKQTANAKELLHPQSDDQSAAIEQMCNYLAGRKATSVELKDVNIQTSTGTGGKSRQEQVVYEATLDDGESLYINALYISNNAGSGFTAFQLVLGFS